MHASTTPLYLDWSFWAVAVAAIAVVLSQLPPIHVLVKRARIEFELYSKIAITHKVGNPNLQLHLLISNIGGRKVRIKNIYAVIARDGKPVASLPVQNYLQYPNDQNNVLFTSFSLRPGEEWGHIINLLNFFGREDEKKYRALEAAMLADFRKKRTETPDEKNELIELEKELVLPFIDFFREHFVWLPGEYRLTVCIETDHAKADISKSFRFTLFESHSDQLRAITDHYKYGGGIWWEPKYVQQNVIIDVQEA